MKKRIKDMGELLVEIIEIWMPVDSGGEAIMFTDGRHLKRIAIIANGTLLMLEKDFIAEKKYITKEELKNIV